MDNETTIPVALPPGTRPNPDLIDTHEIVVVPKGVPADALRLTPPVADTTPMFDRIYGPPPPRRKPVVRRRLSLEDKVLIGLGTAVVVLGFGFYVMVDQGWGVEMPEEKATVAPLRPWTTPAPSWSAETTTRPPRVQQSPVETTVTVQPWPTEPTRTPTPTRSVVVIPSPAKIRPTPTPTEEPPVISLPPTRPSTPPPSPDPEPTLSPSPTVTVTTEPPTTSPSTSGSSNG